MDTGPIEYSVTTGVIIDTVAYAEVVALSLIVILLGSGFRTAGSTLAAATLALKLFASLVRRIVSHYFTSFHNEMFHTPPISVERQQALERFVSQAYLLELVFWSIILVSVVVFVYRNWPALRTQSDNKLLWMVRFGQLNLVFWTIDFLIKILSMNRGYWHTI